MSDPTAAAPAPEKASFIEDLVDIWAAPSKVFARNREGGFFLVMVLVTVLIAVLFIFNKGPLQSIMDGEYNRQMAQVMKQNPQMTADQLAAGKKVAGFFQSVGIFIIMPIAMLMIGLGTWLVSKIVGAEEFGFGQAMMVACWSYLPKAAEGIVTTIQALTLDVSKLTGRFQLSLGVGRFMDPDTTGAGVLALVGRIDVFTIWVSVLIGIGTCVVAKLPKEKVLTVALLIWTWGALPSLWAFAMERLRGG